MSWGLLLTKLQQLQSRDGVIDSVSIGGKWITARYSGYTRNETWARRPVLVPSLFHLLGYDSGIPTRIKGELPVASQLAPA